MMGIHSFEDNFIYPLYNNNIIPSFKNSTIIQKVYEQITRSTNAISKQYNSTITSDSRKLIFFIVYFRHNFILQFCYYLWMFMPYASCLVSLSSLSIICQSFVFCCQSWFTYYCLRWSCFWSQRISFYLERSQDFRVSRSLRFYQWARVSLETIYCG